MSLIARDEKPDRENPKTGLCHAVCAMVRDAGQEDFQGDGKFKRKAWIAWELQQHMSDDRPFMLSKFYTVSLNEKAALRRDLEGMLGRPLTREEVTEGYDLEGLVGQHATLNVVLEEGKDGVLYPKYSSVAPPMEGKADLEIVNTDPPDWVAEKILANLKGGGKQSTPF